MGPTMTCKSVIASSPILRVANRPIHPREVPVIPASKASCTCSTSRSCAVSSSMTVICAPVSTNMRVSREVRPPSKVACTNFCDGSLLRITSGMLTASRASPARTVGRVEATAVSASLSSLAPATATMMARPIVPSKDRFANSSKILTQFPVLKLQTSNFKLLTVITPAVSGPSARLRLCQRSCKPSCLTPQLSRAGRVHPSWHLTETAQGLACRDSFSRLVAIR